MGCSFRCVGCLPALLQQSSCSQGPLLFVILGGRAAQSRLPRSCLGVPSIMWGKRLGALQTDSQPPCCAHRPPQKWMYEAKAALYSWLKTGMEI